MKTPRQSGVRVLKTACALTLVQPGTDRHRIPGPWQLPYSSRHVSHHPIAAGTHTVSHGVAEGERGSRLLLANSQVAVVLGLIHVLSAHLRVPGGTCGQSRVYRYCGNHSECLVSDGHDSLLFA